MLIFVRKNKVISICVSVSFVVCILYMMSLDKEEWFANAGAWFNLVFQFSVGFIKNITQVYIPQYKQNEEANRCIGVRIAGVIGYMREIFSHLGVKYMGCYDENEISDEYMLNLLK